MGWTGSSCPSWGRRGSWASCSATVIANPRPPRPPVIPDLIDRRRAAGPAAPHQERPALLCRRGRLWFVGGRGRGVLGRGGASQGGGEVVEEVLDGGFGDAVQGEPVDGATDGAQRWVVAAADGQLGAVIAERARLELGLQAWQQPAAGFPGHGEGQLGGEVNRGAEVDGDRSGQAHAGGADADFGKEWFGPLRGVLGQPREPGARVVQQSRLDLLGGQVQFHVVAKEHVARVRPVGRSAHGRGSWDRRDHGGPFGARSGCYARQVNGEGKVDLRDLLLEAGLALSSERSLPVILQRIVELATKLTDARYGAIGVLGSHGGIAQFVYTGISAEQRAAIGDPPVGKGILGALIQDARPLRLRDLRADPRSAGFPANHPAMRSFLGAPVMAWGRVFGNIYLTEKRGADEFA